MVTQEVQMSQRLEDGGELMHFGAHQRTSLSPPLWGWEVLRGRDTDTFTNVSTQCLGEARVTLALSG